MTDKPTIAVDFDGVIYHRTKRDHGARTFDGDPVPGAMNFLRHLTSAFTVVIYSARYGGYDGQAAIRESQRWMIKHFHQENDRLINRNKSPFDVIELMDKITFSATKPVARVLLDDRCVCFTGIFPSIKELLEFKPWSEK